MELTHECVQCIISNTMARYAGLETDAQKTQQFKNGLIKIAAQADDDTGSPLLSHLMMQHLSQTIGDRDPYALEKKASNKLMLSMEDDIRQQIKDADDRLQAALKFAMAGNYIDFGASHNVSREGLLNVLGGVDDSVIDQNAYAAFISELKHAHHITYLADNAGEIVLDKIFISYLLASFPALDIRLVVRGMPILNDVTMADAVETGLADMVKVTQNGSGIPGTSLDHINDETRELMQNADVIIAKGQGNFESLFGCGMNIYYLFLCKCNHFTSRFGMKRLQGMFINESAIQQAMKQ